MEERERAAAALRISVQRLWRKSKRSAENFGGRSEGEHRLDGADRAVEKCEREKKNASTAKPGTGDHHD